MSNGGHQIFLADPAPIRHPAAPTLEAQSELRSPTHQRLRRIEARFGWVHHRGDGPVLESEWVTESLKRREDWLANPYAKVVNWVRVKSNEIPWGALHGGQEKDGRALYIARGFVNGSLQVGKVSRANVEGAHVTYEGKELVLYEYEVLVANSQHLRWIDASHACVPSHYIPVEGGREANGDPLYVIHAHSSASIQPGKASEVWGSGAKIISSKRDIWRKKYKVLAYA